VLIIFSGLPGAGKTTLARGLARQFGAVYLRIDTIEVAIARTEDVSIGEAGYRVGYAVAEDNLRLGLTVVADSVNPLRVTRDAWRNAARRAGVASVDVLVVCSDPIEHRRRVETRNTDNAAADGLTWDEVATRVFEPWDREPIVIDTAGRTAEQCLDALKAALSAKELGEA
jgi:predicted kinase